MKRIAAALLPILLLAAAAQAATVQTTLAMNGGTLVINETAGTATVTGTVSLTNLGSGGTTVSGTLTASASLLSSVSASGVSAPFTIAFTTADSLAGTVTLPLSVLSGSSFTSTGTMLFSGGTGAYSGTTGTLSISGDVTGSGPSYTLTLSGSGTLTTSGSGTGGTGGSTTPTVTAVLDAASNTSGVAEGSIFIIKGTNLSGSGYTSFGFPLPTTSGGISITFTPAAGGSGTNAYLIYAYNENGVNQLAAILPSTVAAGTTGTTYNVTVTSGGSTSAPFQATVVQRKFEAFTQDSTGTGLAVTQNYVSASEVDLNRFTTGSVSGVTISPAKPGQPVIVWGTGMGPVTFADNTGSPGYDFSSNGVSVQAIVGGVTIPVAYAGRTPTLAGEDEVVFTLPASIPTGCTVSLQISVNGTLSAPTFISIAPSADASACVQPGFTTTQLQSLDNGGTLDFGSFNITQYAITETGVGTVKVDGIGGGFAQISGSQLASAAQYTSSSSTSGACQVITVSGSGTSLVTGTTTGLDAGTVSINGPSLANVALTETSPYDIYDLSLGNATLGGQYTLSGTGGKDVGKFSVSLSLATPLTLNSALPSTVTRSAGLPLAWSGGNSSDFVEIVGYSGSSTGTAASAVTSATEFICTTTAGTGGFTVPASVLTQLPATPSTTAGGVGLLEVLSGPARVAFTPPLTSGGTIPSTFGALLGSAGLVAYQ